MRGGSNKQSRGGNVKLDQEAINMKIKDEMVNWKDYKKHKGKRNFDWTITENILNSKNNIGEILMAFGENCIDFVLKPEDIDIAYTYICDIFDFYYKQISDKDRKEIKSTVCFFLSLLNDLILDNYFLIDVWGAVTFALIDFKLFSFKEFDELKDMSNDQLKTAFEVANKAIEYYPEDKKSVVVKSLQDIGIFKNNNSLLATIINADV
jgi:hypothetical protein